MGELNFKKIRKDEGFALIEVMVSAVIMILAFAGILVTYLKCMELNEMSRNKSIATRVSKTRMEVINNAPFNQLITLYHGVAFFPISGNRSAGVSYVTMINPKLARITVSFCWRQKNGLLIGEDSDLDGNIDSGEDINGNGMLDSIVQLVTYRYDQ